MEAIKKKLMALKNECDQALDEAEQAKELQKNAEDKVAKVASVKNTLITPFISMGCDQI